MNPQYLQNNDDLYRYLLWLSDELKQKGMFEVSREVEWASKFANGSPSEFLHEAVTALTSAHAKCSDILTEAQLTEVASVIGQIHAAFQRVGGG